VKSLLATMIFFATLLISACGWQLRGLDNQPTLDQLTVVSSNRYAPLTLALFETMQQQDVTHQPNAPLQLHLGEAKLRKRVVAVTSIGSPSQYELTLSVDYQYRVATEQEVKTLPRIMAVTRAFDFDPNNTVAKREEEDTLLEEMRRELALRILQMAPAAVDYGQTKL
jgi:LPS-assembly lipoprotein